MDLSLMVVRSCQKLLPKELAWVINKRPAMRLHPEKSHG